MLLHPVMKTPKLPDIKITEIEKNFGKSLKRYFDNRLKPKGVSQASFAKDLGVKQPTLHAIFSGNRGSTEKWRREVAKFIQKPYEEMIGINTERPPPPEQKLIVETLNGFDKVILEKHADHFRGAPLYETGRLAAFSGGVYFDRSETPDSTVIVHRKELGHHANHDLIAMRVGVEEADSMEPTLFRRRHGDAIKVQPARGRSKIYRLTKKFS
jgi:hypothetical protein